MAKSIRSKTKRAFRAKKRESGVYAATEAARLHRLNSKLASLSAKDLREFAEAEVPLEGEVEKEGWVDEDIEPEIEAVADTGASTDVMDIDAGSQLKPISTHGPRNSRREQWRTSKGISARPESEGMNRQGGIAGRRKAGRSKRRR